MTVTKKSSSSKSASAPAQSAGSVASQKKPPLCWTKRFDKEIASKLIYPFIDQLLGELSVTKQMPKNIKELHQSFQKKYKTVITLKQFNTWCEYLGIKFETQVRIQTNIPEPVKNIQNTNTQELQKVQGSGNFVKPTKTDFEKFGGIDIG
tara:strand:- start:10773 stop:11222 length:450 start_codon:yes stop_codon:yes gene_type:complete